MVIKTNKDLGEQILSKLQELNEKITKLLEGKDEEKP